MFIFSVCVYIYIICIIYRFCKIWKKKYKQNVLFDINKKSVSCFFGKITKHHGLFLILSPFFKIKVTPYFLFRKNKNIKNLDSMLKTTMSKWSIEWVKIENIELLVLAASWEINSAFGNWEDSSEQLTAWGSLIDFLTEWGPHVGSPWHHYTLQLPKGFLGHG